MDFRLHRRSISVRNRQRCEINVAVIGFLAGNIIHPGGDILAIQIKWNTLLIEHQRALPHRDLLYRKIEQVLPWFFIGGRARLRRGLVSGAVRIDHQVKHKTIYGNVFQ